MGEPLSPPRARPATSTYAPDAQTRARLAFADGPGAADEAPHRQRGTTGAGSSRLGLVAATAAVVLVVVVAFVAFGLADRPDSTASEEPERELDRGPFDSVDDFVLALHLPASFTRLAPEDASSFADADYVVTDGDFDAACEGLGRALRDMDPTFPELVEQDYTGGGVNRCEGTGPMAALHGATVRALVLKANVGAQLYIDDVPTSSSTEASSSPPTSPPTSPTP